MYCLTVLYGHPEDPIEFERYYRDVHIPLAKKMNGLAGWTIGKCSSSDAGAAPAYFLVVRLYTETPDVMQSVLSSPEGQATVADVPNFATGGVTFLFSEEEVLIPVSLSN
jgi:uncharacterized protein (TIGR02118 family)